MPQMRRGAMGAHALLAACRRDQSDEAPETKHDEWLTRALRALVVVDLEVVVFLAGALGAAAFALEAGARPVTA